jgi:cytochrome c2
VVRLARIEVLLGALALALGTAGAVELAGALERRAVRSAELEGLRLDLLGAGWVANEMHHAGSGFPMPTSMMPSLPTDGAERLTVRIALWNTGTRVARLSAGQFELRSELGRRWPALASQDLDGVALAPDSGLNASVHFDYRDPSREERTLDSTFRVVWSPGDEEASFPVPHPPSHDHAEDEGWKVAEWPASVSALPTGNAEAGWFLFSTRHGCVSCHGHPGLLGTNTVGPHLGGIGISAMNRVPGTSPAQYLYDAIVRPGAHVAPGSTAAGTAYPPMPLTNLSEQEAADLVAYLLDQTQPEQNPGPARAPSARASALPASVDELPGGDAERGRALFAGRAACASCHGDPAVRASNTRGPDLYGSATFASARVPGQSAAEYLYAAIARPSEFLAEAPVFAGERLTSMPETELTPQEAADLLAYLLAPAPIR